MADAHHNLPPPAYDEDSGALPANDEDALEKILRDGFVGIAQDSSKTMALFEGVAIDLVRIDDKPKQRDWDPISKDFRKIMVASKDLASTLSASMKMFTQAIIPMSVPETKIMIVDKLLEKNKDRDDETQSNVTEFKKVIAQVAAFADKLEQEVAADDVATKNKVAAINARIGILQAELDKYAGKVEPDEQQPAAADDLPSQQLNGVLLPDEVLAVRSLKKQIAAQQTELHNAKASALSTDPRYTEVRHKLAELSPAKTTSLGQRLELFAQAWDFVRKVGAEVKACADPATATEEAKKALQRSEALFKMLTVCFDSYATGSSRV